MISVMSLMAIIYSVIVLIREKNIRSIFISFLTVELVLSFNKINRGFFLEYGNYLIQVDDYFLGILSIISAIIIIKRKKVNKKIFIAASILVMVVILGLIKVILFPETVSVVPYGNSWDLYLMGQRDQMQNVAFSSQGILIFFRLMLFIIILLACKCMIKLEDWIIIGKKLLFSSKLLFLYCFVEMIFKYVLKSDALSLLLDIIMGKSQFLAVGTTRLQGLSLEPSYLAIVIYNFLVLYLVLSVQNTINEKRVKTIFWCVYACAIGFLSGAFSVILSMASVGIVYIIYTICNIRHEKRNIIIVCCSFLAILFVVLFVFSETFIRFAQLNSNVYLFRLGNSLQIMKYLLTNPDYSVVSLAYTSEATRLSSLIITFRASMSSPLIGLGVGSAYCTSGIISIISNVGIIGFWCWCYILFYGYSSQKSNRRFLTIFLLLPMLLSGDMYLLYDTSLLILIPMFESIICKKEK